MPLHDLVESFRVPDVAYLDAYESRPLRLELEVELVQPRFVDVDEHDSFGVETHDLTREFRADRPCGAGDRDDVAGDASAHLLHVDRRRLSAEKVLDLNAAQVAKAHRPAGDDQLRCHECLDASVGCCVENAADRLERRRGHRDDDLRDVQLGDGVPELGRPAQDGDAVDGAAVQCGIVVEE